jgi:hypothetical protein
MALSVGRFPLQAVATGTEELTALAKKGLANQADSFYPSK